MIEQAIEYIRQETRTYLELADDVVIIDNAHVLKDRTESDGAYISLVNVQEENTLKNLSHTVRVNGNLQFKEPPLFLNIFLLFSFAFTNYNTSLEHLSKTAEMFQSKNSYSSSNASDNIQFPSNLEKLVFDLYNLDFETLNQLWGVLGSHYYPSLLYKVRLIKIQVVDQEDPGPEIITIKTDIEPI